MIQPSFRTPRPARAIWRNPGGASGTVRVRGLIAAVCTYLLMAAPWSVAHEGRLTFAPVLSKVTPAVVNISVSATRPQRVNPLFEDRFSRRFSTCLTDRDGRGPIRAWVPA